MARSILLSVLLAFANAAAPAFAAGKPTLVLEPPVLTTRVDARIEIDREGRLVRYEPTTALPEGMADRIAEMAKKLRFEPVQVNGVVVNAVTRMRITLAARQLPGDAMEVRVDNITFPGEPGATESDEVANEAVTFMGATRRVSPQYPREALQVGANANVLVVVRIGLDGRVEDASVRQSSLLHARGTDRQMAAVLELFEQASLKAIRRWQFPLTVKPGAAPTPEQLTGLVPIEYRVHGVPEASPGKWILETRTPVRVASWLVGVSTTTAGVGVSDVSGSGMVTSDARIRLATPLAEMAL